MRTHFEEIEIEEHFLEELDWRESIQLGTVLGNGELPDEFFTNDRKPQREIPTKVVTCWNCGTAEGLPQFDYRCEGCDINRDKRRRDR